MRRLLVALCAALAACSDDEPAKPDPTAAACMRMQAHIESLLGRKFQGPVPVEIVDVDFIAEFAAELERQMIPPGFAEIAIRFDTRLKLVPEGFDAEREMMELIKLMVVGLYDPQKDRFYLIEGRAAPGGDEFAATLAHELVHAYRDIDKGYYEKIVAAVMVDMDRAIAISCMIEGDATLLGQSLGPTLGTARGPTPLLKHIASRADVIARTLGQNSVPPEMREFPYALREMFFGRYGAGLVFASKLYNQGGLAALASAFDVPPRSTEQVLHPEKYYGAEKDEPTLFSGGDPTNALGDGWKQSMTNTYGEFQLRVLFAEELGRDAAWKAAAGWDGARFYFCEKEGVPSFVGLVTTWDTERDAKEFAKAWAKWAAMRDDKPGVVVETSQAVKVKTADGHVAIRTIGKDVLVADGVPKGRVEAVFAALASATRK